MSSSKTVSLPAGADGGDPSGACPWCGALLIDASLCLECGRELRDPRLGSVVADRYRVDALIGAGGFGRVYRATHLALGEPVALKFLLSEWTGRPDIRARFKREAVALARLRHPGIVAVQDYGEHAGELYMAMELMRGQSLDRLVMTAGATLPILRVLDVMDQVLQVLESAHAQSIVHRDLKPENVMVLDAADRAGRIKVLDFGLALMSDVEMSARLTATHAVQGTPLYMSPEQCRGRDVGAPTDIYAAGAMFFELLAGEPPFGGTSAADIIVKHMFVDPPAVSERGVRPAVPPPVEALVRWALAKQPEDRPTALQFRDAIRAVLDGTDAVSSATRAAALRAGESALDRDARALFAAPVAIDARTVPQGPAALTPDGEGPRVVLWCLPDARAERLRDALAANGVVAVIWRGDSPPSAAYRDRAVRAVLVAGDAAATDRVRAVRQTADISRVPVLALDVRAVDETAALVRAGASDVSYTAASDDAVCKQVWRLVRRGR